MRNPLIFSLWLCLASLLLVYVSPFKVAAVEEETAARIVDGKVYSPYHEESDRLLEEGKNGMTSAQLERWKAAVQKNNQWFEDYRKNPERYTKLDALGMWKRKSTNHTPLVAVMWGLLFYIFYRGVPGERPLLVLVFPAVLTAAQLFPIIETVFIALAVLLVWFYLLFVQSSPSENAS